jgi:aminoglycoside 3-N-acetyltransferase
MYTNKDLLKQLEASNINVKGTLMVHSSMKAIGQVDGAPKTVIDTLCHYMKDGLLLFPTHSWDENSLKDDTFNVRTERSCVGILTNTVLTRNDVVRSLHPTHSVAAYGKRKVAYTNKDKIIIQRGEQLTPCPRYGCFGSLYDEDSQILFIGATLKTDTYIHSIEEWLNIPDRLRDRPRLVKVIDYDQTSYDVKLIGHYHSKGDISKNYDRIEPLLFKKNIASRFTFGDADCILVQVKEMTEMVLDLLNENPNYFGFK